MTITVLPSSAYLTTHELITEGQMGVTRKISVEWDDGSLKKCYIKIYQPQERARKICNELTGFVIARALGLVQPEAAALMPLSSDFYNDYVGISDLDHPNKIIWAWLTTECGSSVKGSFHLNVQDKEIQANPHLQGLLRQAFKFVCDQKSLPDLIAFDDFTGNDDRNIGNLVIVGDGQLGIIDHGEILGRIDWLKDYSQLDKNQHFGNVLLLILKSLHDVAAFPIQHKAVVASEQHQMAYISVQNILKTWWNNILEATAVSDEHNEKCIDSLSEFLHYRCHQPSTSFAGRIGLVA